MAVPDPLISGRPPIGADERASRWRTLVRQGYGALAAQDEQGRRQRGHQRENAGAEEDFGWWQTARQQEAAQGRRRNAPQAADAERPADPGGAHACRIERTACRIGARLAADDRQAGEE